MRENQQIHELLIQFINFIWYLLHVSALHCHPQRVFSYRIHTGIHTLEPSESCSIRDSVDKILWMGVLCLVTWCLMI
jgi:hypothetical protein